MSTKYNSSRRNMLKAGVAAIPAALSTMTHAEDAFAAKVQGRIKVVAIAGDNAHNPLWVLINLRSIFGKMDWDVYFTQYSDAITPELLSDTDLFISQRFGSTDPLGFVPRRLIKLGSEPPGAVYITPEQEDAIIDNIKNRGMGYLSVHCAFWNQQPKIKEMLGIEQGMHPAVQPVWFRKMNQNHPITRGVESFVEVDEQFFVRMNNPNHTVLFHSTGGRDQRETISGWCFEYGKGRVTAILPGHTRHTWRHPVFQQLVLRSSLWVLGRDIPDNVASLVGSQEVRKKPVGGVGEDGSNYYDGFQRTRNL